MQKLFLYLLVHLNRPYRSLSEFLKERPLPGALKRLYQLKAKIIIISNLLRLEFHGDAGVIASFQEEAHTEMYPSLHRDLPFCAGIRWNHFTAQSYGNWFLMLYIRANKL